MKYDRTRDISRRMREMLLKDTVDVKEGFLTAMRGDVAKLAAGYFALTGEPKIAIDRQTDGGYKVEISFLASDILQFDTTLDIKRF